MGCERCGGRMVSRTGSDRMGLVCSDCGTPVDTRRQPGKPHPLSASLLMITVAAFSVLLFFLTNWRPTHPERTSERGMIKKVTTGAFERDPELLDKGSHHDD